MAKETTYQLQAFDNGQSASPFKGFEHMVNVDLTTTPGVARVALQALTMSGATITGSPTMFARGAGVSGSDYLFCIDNTQKVYKSTDQGNTWTLITGNTSTGHGNGIAVYKGFLAVAGDSNIDWYDIDNNSWINGAFGIALSTDVKPLLWGQDDILYIGGGNYIASIHQNLSQTSFQPYNDKLTGSLSSGATTFNVTYPSRFAVNDVIQVDAEQMQITGISGSTLTVTRGYNSTSAASHSSGAAIVDSTTPTFYTFTNKALSLPSNVFVRCLAELGVNLLIGTWNDTVHSPFARVYPWDRSSTSFNLPLLFSGDGIHAMVTQGQYTYVLHGKTGKLSYTNGYAVFPVPGINYPPGELCTPAPAAMITHNGKIMFGFGSGVSYPVGIYSYVPAGTVGNQYDMFYCENTVGSGSDSSTTIGCLMEIDSNHIVAGWQHTLGGTTQGVDMIGNNNYRYSNESTYIDGPFENCGLPLAKKKFTKCSVQLEKALTTGQKIGIYYRTDRGKSFKQIDSDFTSSNKSGLSSWEVASPIPETDSIQLRAFMSSGSNDTDSPGLMQVTLE